MARIKVEEIVEHLECEIKIALEAVAKKALPGSQVNKNELFREFKRALSNKCSTWERVPDTFVQHD